MRTPSSITMAFSLALCPLLLCGCALRRAPDRPAPRYTVTDLGTLPTYAASAATGINNKGEVVGRAYNASATGHAFLWSEGSLQDLGPSGTLDCRACSINNSGQVVGSGCRTGVVEHAVLYEEGRMQNLIEHDPADSLARAIDDRGLVVGEQAARPRSKLTRAVYWSHGRCFDLRPHGIGISKATALNNHGQIVGSAKSEQKGWAQAFLWTKGRMNGIQTPAGFRGSEAYALNDRGDIAGCLIDAIHVSHACLWSEGRAFKLGGPDEKISEARSINAAGQVVGWVAAGPGIRYAFIYHDGKIIDLNTLVAPNTGWQLRSANGINDKGQIVGAGVVQVEDHSEADDERIAGLIQEECHAFLLTPIAGQ